jgi:DNA-binding NarL/FixJ family response regulator
MSAITVLTSAPCAAFAHNLHAGEFAWVGVAKDNAHALAMSLALRPNVYLLDHESFSTDGAAFLLQLHAASPHTKVLLFYDRLNHADIVDFLEAGAKGCLPFSSPVSHVLKAIRAVHNGDIWLARKDMVTIVEGLLYKQHMSPLNNEAQANRLSAREREVATHMSNGLSNKAIGQRLGISDLTVKTHLKHIFHKLNISRRNQLGIAPTSTSQQ